MSGPPPNNQGNYGPQMPGVRPAAGQILQGNVQQAGLTQQQMQYSQQQASTMHAQQMQQMQHPSMTPQAGQQGYAGGSMQPALAGGVPASGGGMHMQPQTVAAMLRLPGNPVPAQGRPQQPTVPSQVMSQVRVHSAIFCPLHA